MHLDQIINYKQETNKTHKYVIRTRLNNQSSNLSILKLYKKSQIFKTLNYGLSIDYFSAASRMLEDLSL
jgi:hypothetical protein